MTRLVSCIYIVFCIVLLLDDCLNVKCSFEERYLTVLVPGIDMDVHIGVSFVG